MKAILCVGAVLMTGASIYGFVNYRNSSNDKAFINLYENKKSKETKELQPEVSKPVNEVIIDKEAKEPARKASKRKAETREDEVTVTHKKDDMQVDVIEEPKKALVPVTLNTEDAGKTIKPKKTIKTKMFSRGALEQPVIEKELKPEKKTKAGKGS